MANPSTMTSSDFKGHVQKLSRRERHWARAHGILRAICYLGSTIAALCVSLHTVNSEWVSKELAQTATILVPTLLALAVMFSRFHQWHEETLVQLNNVCRLLEYIDIPRGVTPEQLLPRVDWVNIIMANAAKARPDYKQLQDIIGAKKPE